MHDKWIITLNSTILYILAFLTSTFLHESAHAFAGWIFNSSPVLHQN